MIRNDMLARIRDHRRPWDVAVIGGGATGVGVALDAAARGYDVVLLEQADFGKGTSSRSTKLVHGGVRYLERGDIPLVMEALQERGLLRRNAPHLVSDLPFLVPTYVWWEGPFYGIGLRVYDLLAGRYGFGRSRNLSREETLERIPTLRTEGLRGGVLYHDGQFDDTRLLIHLARTAAEQGAVLLNYAPVLELLRESDGMVGGLVARDDETGAELRITAKVVINAAGPFCDAVRRLAEPAAPPIIVPSQGTHVVLPANFLQGRTAIMVPHTPDGRVLFAIPWHGHTLVGTTDTLLPASTLEPTPTNEEIDFILETASSYLEHPPTRADVLSTFAGIRPLVAPGGHTPGATAKISRNHHIDIDQAGLVTIAGGKWTTYRKMAEDCVDQAALLGHLEERPCVTKRLHIHGYREGAEDLGSLSVYGADAPALRALAAPNPALGERLHPELPYLAAEVIWAARFEMARTVEDVLARRTRALFLNARAARTLAPRVAELLVGELGRDAAWAVEEVRRFEEVAKGYVVTNSKEIAIS
jgi:glycerol-3-phosphate dehydrogenase